MVIETARKTGVATHFMPWDSNGSMEPGHGVDQGRRHRHAPRSPQLDQPPRVAAVRHHSHRYAARARGLRLGPVARTRSRAALPPQLHPHGVPRLVRFRRRLHGGHGPLQPLDRLQCAGARSGPTSVEPMLTHDCMFKEGVSTTIKNDFSFPTAGVVRFRYPARGAAAGHRSDLVRRRHASAHARGARRRSRGIARSKA